MSDEQDGFEEWLTQAARDYNRPPAETPRDAMWARIEAARRQSGAAQEAGAGAGGPPVPPAPYGAAPHTGGVSGWTWARRGLAAAAVLLMGIAIGRYSHIVVGGGPSAGGEILTGETTQAAGVGRPPVQPDGGVEPLPSPIPPDMVAKSGRRGSASGGSDGSPRDAESPNGGADAFQMAAVQHLTQAEALLTAYRVDERAGRSPDAQLAASARDLLSTTRLLADSPAADDPKVRRLLEDLELVLAQIALLSRERSAGERQLIDHALEERAVMPRLRTAIPAGQLNAGT